MMLADIGKYLQENGLGTVGKDIFIGAFPAKPNNCLSLFEYQGRAPNQMAGTTTPGLQVVSRAKQDYLTADVNLQAVHDALKRIGFAEDACLAPGIVINGAWYFRAEPIMSGVIPLGEDENGRIRLARNYYITKEDK